MSRQGWIKLHRKLADDPFWLDGKAFDHRSAWADMLMLAAGEDDKEHQKGRLYCSVTYLAERWKWSKGKVIRYLEMLEKKGMFKRDEKWNIKRNTKKCLGTVVKYGFYQVQLSQNGTRNGTKNGTNKEEYKELSPVADAPGSARERGGVRKRAEESGKKEMKKQEKEAWMDQ